MKKSILTPSYLSVIAICAIVLYSIFNIRPWRNAEKISLIINNDVVSYYAYLPAYFIHNDIKLDFTKDSKIDYWKKRQFWPETAPNGGKVIKTTMGISILYSPFFLMGHLYASISDNYEANGFSTPYEFFLALSSFFYLIIGLYYLRKLLLRSFNERITSITLICILFGTNLYYYCTSEICVSHAYNFSLIAMFIYYVIKWHEQQKIISSIVLGLVGGLIILIRPVNLLIFIVPLLYQVSDLKELKYKMTLFIKNWKHLFLIFILVLVVVSPQLFYWKYITGDWFFNSYVGEKFYFSKPHLLEFLFSYRKGWLLYTPIMLFSLVGLVYLFKNEKKFFYGTVLFLIINIYVLSSWWCWWYGGSYGMRSMVDAYALLSIPLAISIDQLMKKKKILQYSFSILLIGMIGLNLFQTAQKRNNVIHWDSMSKAAYWTNFNKLRMKTAEDWKLLEEQKKTPNYEAARKGINEYDFDPF